MGGRRYGRNPDGLVAFFFFFWESVAANGFLFAASYLQAREKLRIYSRRMRHCAVALLAAIVNHPEYSLLIVAHGRDTSADFSCLSQDAGHTIVHDSVTYDFHILPSGLVSPTCINLIGAGTVVHIPSFFKELAALEEKGLKDASKRVFISDRAHVCFDLHSVVDGLEEAKRGGRKVGTTGKGIGPCYSDKAARRGVRVGEILDEELFERKLRTLESIYKNRFGELVYDVEEEIGRFKVAHAELILYLGVLLIVIYCRNTVRS